MVKKEDSAMPEPQSLDEFIKQQLQSGRYSSYEDMVKASLHLLQEREEEAGRIAGELRPAYERFKRGDPGLPLDADDVIRRGRERNAANHPVP
jgi:putative addiction module CopG family antidote